jgi:superoxide dismutase, Fe-Mn family
MKYRIAPLFCRPWTLNGISPRLIESHYENNYGTSLNRLNDITEKIEQLDLKKTPGSIVKHLHQEQSRLLNSTLLHELYFASLGGDGRTLPETITAAITRDFGSVNHWRDEFIALAEALGGDSGWILLTYVPRDGRLMNICATDDSQSIAGGIPVLALDMYEHAYHLEYGANAAAYVAAFMRNIHWDAVQNRYKDATQVTPPRPLEQPEFGTLPSISPEELQDMLKAGRKVQIIDTRPRHYSARTHDMVADAVWRDPEHIGDWIDTLSKDEPVVTLCVYGFHIGCQSATALREAGFDARYMAGGHFAWKAINGPMKLIESR